MCVRGCPWQNDRWTTAAHPDSKPHSIGYVKPLDLEPVEHEGYMIEYAEDYAVSRRRRDGSRKAGGR